MAPVPGRAGNATALAYLWGLNDGSGSPSRAPAQDFGSQSNFAATPAVTDMDGGDVTTSVVLPADGKGASHESQSLTGKGTTFNILVSAIDSDLVPNETGDDTGMVEVPL